MEPELSVAIPAYNEENNLAPLVEQLVSWARQFGIALEVVIVDDGSSDGTLAEAEKLAEKHSEARVLVHERNRGLGAAMWTGLSAARGEIITWIPADGQILPPELNKMLDGIRGVDAVTTYYTNERPESFFRLVMSKVHRTLIRIVDLRFKWRIQGPMMIRRGALAGLRVTTGTGTAETELAIRAFRRGAKFSSVGIIVGERMSGRSKVANIRTILKSVWELAGLKWTLAVRR